VAPYQTVIPGLLDYVTYYPTIRALSSAGQMAQLYDTVAQLPGTLADVTVTGRFLENQDNPRFANQVNDTGLQQTGFVFNILSDAIPIVGFISN
jgi:alpha-amylase